MTLLYRTAEWHAFAKLRLHTESTLQHLEQLTTELGQLTRKFRDTTQSAFKTFELPKEKEARNRRQNSGKGKGKEKSSAFESGKKSKLLNLFTYKWHALGDYVRSIRLFGPTDGFSTQVVSHFFSIYLVYSHFLFNRVNSLTKLLSACTDQQISAKLNTKLLNVIEGLNAPVWPLTGSSITIRKQQIKKTSWMVTRS